MEAWQAPNVQLIEKLGLKGRERSVPDTGVVVGMEAGRVYAPDELPAIEVAPGVKAGLSWGKGSLLELLEMAPGSIYPVQAMTGELIFKAEDGSATCTVDDRTLELDSDSIVYLTQGMSRSLRAGPNGFKAYEMFSPVRVDHLRLAGSPMPEGADVSFPDQGVEQASLEPAVVHSFNDIRVTPIIMPGKDPSEPSTARSRFVWGKNFMLSFIFMDPNSSFPLHIHPEDQLMMIMEGAMEEGIIEEWLPMYGDKRHVILQPGGMTHAARLSPQGAYVVDIFWPVRPDYLAMWEQQAEQNK